jgi:cytochrome P450
MYIIYGMNRCGKRWPEPDAFRPERWETARPTSFEFPTFHAGPRACLGKLMAQVEFKILLAMVLQRFRLELACDPASVSYAPSLTMPVRGGLRVRVERLTKC